MPGAFQQGKSSRTVVPPLPPAFIFSRGRCPRVLAVAVTEGNRAALSPSPPFHPLSGIRRRAAAQVDRVFASTLEEMGAALGALSPPHSWCASPALACNNKWMVQLGRRGGGNEGSGSHPTFHLCHLLAQTKQIGFADDDEWAGISGVRGPVTDCEAGTRN